MNAAENAGISWPAFARQTIECAMRGGELGQIAAPATEVDICGGVFVTLRKFRRLRGCMGTLDPTRSLTEAVRDAAVSAALHDPRFTPVAAGELSDIVIEVSIMSPPWPMRDLDELERGRHGIIVRRGLQQGLFLPQVATEHGLDKETFLSRCCSEKAGLPAEAWRDADTEVLLFTTRVFAEAEDHSAG